PGEPGETSRGPQRRRRRPPPRAALAAVAVQRRPHLRPVSRQRPACARFDRAGGDGTASRPACCFLVELHPNRFGPERTPPVSAVPATGSANVPEEVTHGRPSPVAMPWASRGRQPPEDATLASSGG